jgi:hypothetical protein
LLSPKSLSKERYVILSGAYFSGVEGSAFGKLTTSQSAQDECYELSILHAREFISAASG